VLALDSIYLNNFRGISDAVLTPCPVNFLVGENSTGKTSVLGALKLLGSPDFLYNTDFNGGDYEFGGYRDIVSVDAANKSEFQLGLYKQDTDQPKRAACYMLHFREGKDGLAKLVRFSQLCGQHVVTLRLAPNAVSAYGTKDVPECFSALDLPRCFEYLRTLPSTVRGGYKEISGDISRFVRNNPVASFSNVLSKLFPENELEENENTVFPFPLITQRLASLAPIRTKPKRTYDGFAQKYSPEGDHTPYLIRSKVGRKKDRSSLRASLETFGRDSGLFSTVGVSQYGRDSSAPFELRVGLSNWSPLRINCVGYGVSQVLPVVVELLARADDTWFMVQQPEVHLHPRAQAALGDVFFQAAHAHKKVLFIETHSDFMIDRFRLNYGPSKPRADFAQILFFERTGGGNKLTTIKILSDGEYPEDQAAQFRSFFLEEQRKLLGF